MIFKIAFLWIFHEFIWKSLKSGDIIAENFVVETGICMRIRVLSHTLIFSRR